MAKFTGPHSLADETKERSLADHVNIQLLEKRTLMLTGEIDRKLAQLIMSQLILLA